MLRESETCLKYNKKSKTCSKYLSLSRSLTKLCLCLNLEQVQNQNLKNVVT